MCGCVYVLVCNVCVGGVCNVWVCLYVWVLYCVGVFVCVGIVLCGCVYVWVYGICSCIPDSPHHPCHQQAASPVLYTTSCKHSLVFLRMGEIIAQNMLS